MSTATFNNLSKLIQPSKGAEKGNTSNALIGSVRDVVRERMKVTSIGNMPVQIRHEEEEFTSIDFDRCMDMLNAKINEQGLVVSGKEGLSAPFVKKISDTLAVELAARWPGRISMPLLSEASPRVVLELKDKLNFPKKKEISALLKQAIQDAKDLEEELQNGTE